MSDHAVADGGRRLPLVDTIYRAIDKRIDTGEPGDILLREVALALAAVHAGDEDRRGCGRITPEAKRDSMSPPLRPHDFSIKRRPLQRHDGTRKARAGREYLDAPVCHRYLQRWRELHVAAH